MIQKYLYRICDSEWYSILIVFLLASITSLITLKSKRIRSILAHFDKHSRFMLVYFAFGLYFFIFSTLSLLNHFSMNTYLDLAVLDQCIRNSLIGKIAYSSINGKSFFSMHFSPLIVILSPLSLLSSSSTIWLVLQALVLAFPSLLIYKITFKKLESHFAAFSLSISYLFFPFLHSGNMADFHLEAFTGIFILLSFFALLEKKMWIYWLSLILAWTIKEDISLYTIPFGLLVMRVENRKKTGALTMILSAVWFLLCIKLIVPLFTNDSYRFFSVRYSWLGESISDIVLNFFKEPLNTFQHLMRVTKFHLIPILLIPVGFLPLASFWGIALISLPALANFLSLYPPQYKFAGHYPLHLVPFLYLGAIYGFKHILKLIREFKFFDFKYAVWIFVLVGGILSAFSFSQIHNIKKAKMHQYIFYSRIKTQIPKEASISTQNNLLSHFSNRKILYMFPNIKNARYVLVDSQGDYWPMSKSEFTSSVLRLLQDPKFIVIDSIDGYLLFKKKIAVKHNVI